MNFSVAFLSQIDGDEVLQDFALVIDRTPQMAVFAVYLRNHLVEVPLSMAIAAHPTDPLAAEVAREHWAEPTPPAAHRLLDDVDAAFEQQVLDVPKTERLFHVPHHR